MAATNRQGRGSNQYQRRGTQEPSSRRGSVSTRVDTGSGNSELLSRAAFREQVLSRHNGRCCVPDCHEPASAAHHILNRNLYPDGGYYLANGAALCDAHHLDAEHTTLSVEDLRLWSQITHPVIPEHLSLDDVYDTWGNVVLADGHRVPGELFHDEGAQQALTEGGVLDRFKQRWKYPRTPHLPWSPGATRDDIYIPSLEVLQAGGIVVTEKMDGECTTLYRDGLHARSVESASHPSRTWVTNMHAGIAHDIPAGWRICGENLYARHSIAYPDLPSFFLVFSVWDDRNRCLSWDDTVEWCELLGLNTVPVLMRGQWDEPSIKQCWHPEDRDRREGYVVRTDRGFRYPEFRWHVAKFVRERHVTTSDHWAHQQVVPNTVRSVPG